jgi:hypothetical protein
MVEKIPEFVRIVPVKMDRIVAVNVPRKKTGQDNRIACITPDFKLPVNIMSKIRVRRRG